MNSRDSQKTLKAFATWLRKGARGVFPLRWVVLYHADKYAFPAPVPGAEPLGP